MSGEYPKNVSLLVIALVKIFVFNKSSVGKHLGVLTTVMGNIYLDANKQILMVLCLGI